MSRILGARDRLATKRARGRCAGVDRVSNLSRYSARPQTYSAAERLQVRTWRGVSALPRWTGADGLLSSQSTEYLDRQVDQRDAASGVCQGARDRLAQCA